MHELAFRTEKNLLRTYLAELNELNKTNLFSFERFVFTKNRIEYLKEKISQFRMRTEDEEIYKARFLSNIISEEKVEHPLITKDFSEHLKETYSISSYRDILELGEEWWLEVSSTWIPEEKANKIFGDFIERCEDVLSG